MLQIVTTFLNEQPEVLAFISLVAAFFLTVKFCPIIIAICRKTKLMDTPNERSAHSASVPTYGGVAIFIAFAVVFMVVAMVAQLSAILLGKSMLLMAALTLLFFLGMKDDMIGLHPKKKFTAQFIVAALVIFLGDVRIESMGGIFGVYQLPHVVSVLFSLFVFMLVSNAYNLIDGIDGLAGSISGFVGLFFGVCFLWEGQLYLALPALILSGASLGFLRFNLSKNKKLFMGDSGSLFMGFLLGYLGITFLQEVGSTGTIAKAHPPVLLLAVLSYPLLDTLRVFALRMLDGRSPFSADKNHLHHRLLEKGLTHAQATLLIIVANLTVIALSWGSQTLSVTVQCLLVVGLGSLVYLAPIMILPNFNTRLQKKFIIQNRNFIVDPEIKSQRKISLPDLFHGYKSDEVETILDVKEKVFKSDSNKPKQCAVNFSKMHEKIHEEYFRN